MFQISLKNNWLFKTQMIPIYCGVCSIFETKWQLLAWGLGAAPVLRAVRLVYVKCTISHEERMW